MHTHHKMKNPFFTNEKNILAVCILTTNEIKIVYDNSKQMLENVKIYMV